MYFQNDLKNEIYSQEKNIPNDIIHYTLKVFTLVEFLIETLLLGRINEEKKLVAIYRRKNNCINECVLKNVTLLKGIMSHKGNDKL